MSRVRVLVVDDSAFARKVLREILSADDRIEVIGTARDGLDALEQIATLDPDVITLDLVMPHLDGLGVLRAMPPGRAGRVVVVSSARDDSEGVVEALLAGAVTAVHKPTPLATDWLYDMSADVVGAVLRAASSRRPTAAPVAAAPVALAGPIVARRDLIVIGASTGGPHAITRVLTALPATFPLPIAVVLHMPIGYTEAFATRLDDLCALQVLEAQDEMPLVPGRVVIGRAGLHLAVDGSVKPPVARLDPRPLDRPHRPSVDVLFGSAAATLGGRVLGVVLTGMGDDGLAGSRAVVDAGGTVITQSAPSCVVYGMPRSVVEAGLSDAVVDLEDIADAIVSRL